MAGTRVFFDVSVGTEPIGRLTMELFSDKAPKTCENFRILCTGEKPPLTYKIAPFHRIIDEFMVQGGDITKGDGTGGESIYGGEFADENIGWREIDERGLLCMANRGKDTNSSQFFLTLEACPHLNQKHTVFGRLVAGIDTLERMAKLKVGKDDRPLDDVFISHCGELERRKKPTGQEDKDVHMATSHSRGRGKRRHDSLSRSRSRDPSRGLDRDLIDEPRRRRNDRDKGYTSESRSPTPQIRDRKRSDASPDHTLRGRLRHRSRSRTRSPLPEYDGSPARNYRKRSPPPSRPRSHSRDTGYRRQRSLPNQYRDWREDDRPKRKEARREADHWSGNTSGRLGGGAWGVSKQAGGDDGIAYKGRGAMKYREQKKRW